MTNKSSKNHLVKGLFNCVLIQKYCEDINKLTVIKSVRVVYFFITCDIIANFTVDFSLI
jgi:hypothetical protein